MSASIESIVRRFWRLMALGAIFSHSCLNLAAPQPRDASRLPYDRLNPVVYDNDEAVDMYTDEYLLALSSLGEIRLKGVMTSTPTQPYDWYVAAKDVQREIGDRNELLANARESGLTIPVSMNGAIGNLRRPNSGKIEDTQPIDNPGSRFIIAEAKKASVGRPLVVVDGAPLTTEASAYLLDPSIGDKIVIAWLGGSAKDMCDYNGWADPWAAYIVLSKLRLVQFPLNVGPPEVRKLDLLALPRNPLQHYMYRKHHPRNSDPGDVDGDGPPAISLNRPDYPLEVVHASFSRWVSCRLYPATGASDDHPVPAFEDWSEHHLVPGGAHTPEGLVVRTVDQRVATSEWWKTMRTAFDPKRSH